MSRAARVLPLLAAVVAVLPNPVAAVPALTYYFRDFTVTFYPLRLFVARELRAGRIPWWNPYVNEGAFVLPILYPVDLLHALFPGPVAVSWLLTLHLPLAALAMYALARDLDAPPLGAFASACVFAVSGLAVSSLNLYVFLEALALAPLVVLTLRRAAVRGGRWTALAAAALAASLATLAVEFVVQAVVLGLATAWADRADRRGSARLLAAGAIACALAAVPLLTVAAVLPETVRGAGFGREIALGNELHPAALAQAVVPRLFGDPAAPVDAWWGGRFFTKGFPYFLTVYVGPLALCLAAAGLPDAPARRRRAWLAAAGLALWYALGARGGLATAVSLLPGTGFFRFPSKALLLPLLVLALLAGLGLGRLAAGARWRTLSWPAGALAAAGLALALLSTPAAAAIAVTPTVPMAAVAGALAADGWRLLALAGAAVLLGAMVIGGRLAADRGALALAALLAADLVSAAHGVNPQAPDAFYRPLPEMEALRLGALDGGRVFTYGLDGSPAFRRVLATTPGGRGLWSFFLSRQVLAPYANIVDGVEIAEGKDLTGFIPRPPVIAGEDLDPARIAAVLPRLRDAAVSRVVSLDPLDHPDLRLLARVPAGPPGTDIHVYAVADPWPRAFLDCGDGCAGTVRRHARAGETQLDVQAPAAGELVVRDNFARGWRAEVDGEPAAVRDAAGHLAVAVGPGAHRVVLRYRPPALGAGLALTVFGAAALAWAAASGRRRGPPGGPGSPPRAP